MAILKENRAASVPHSISSPKVAVALPLSYNGRTHQGVPADTARLVGTAGACHLEGAIAMKLQRGRGAPQVPSPGLRAAELLSGKEQQSR